MLVKTQAFPAPNSPLRAKQLYLCPESSAPAMYAPYCFIEARIDYADVRTGYHMTQGLNHVLEFSPVEEDLVWTPDMVWSIDPSALQTVKPDWITLGAFPDYVNEETLAHIETLYLRYLLRHADARVLRNFALSVYSQPGESRQDFFARCVELLGEPFRSELEELREVVNRRLERMEQKYLCADRPGEFESDRRITQARSRFFAMAEGIAQLFLGAALTMEAGDGADRRFPDPTRPDLEQSLEALEIDARQDIRRLLGRYQERAGNIDEYIIHPGLRDLHLVRTCILWMPAKVWEL